MTLSEQKGVSLTQLLTNTILAPIYTLKWGEDIPPEIMEAMRNGQTAILLGEDGKPYSWVMMDYFGTIREKQLTDNDSCKVK